MVAEDALAAAKSAALQDLLTRSATELPATSLPINGSRDFSSKKTRRRRRRRNQSYRQSSPKLEERPSPDVDYVPESLEGVSSVLEHITDDENTSAVGQIMSSINRFAEMGSLALENEDSAGEDDAQTPGVSASKRTDSSAHGEEKTTTEGSAKQGEPNGDTKALKPLSRKKQKEQRRALIARLKEVAEKPEVVESWDINSPDPILLVHLKSFPNSVQVPVNWSQKRKYLQNKRGMEKRPFQLPAYIMDTGVGSLRDAQLEADEKKTLKQRQREKMRAKTGRGVEVDTQRLHDAFFKFQTKPRLTKHGEIYYELKELETDASQFTPGYISEELGAALGISVHDPPPWLINMQRYGPPPGYPGIMIPGVNAPIPPGARFGYQAGGWGKPPVDASGRPIYGDVFGEGLSYGGEDPAFETSQAEKDHLWGEIKSTQPGVTVRAEDLESEGEDDDEQGLEDDKTVKTGWKPTQLDTSVAAKDRRVDENDRRNRQYKEQENGTEEDQGVADRKLFTVLEERKVSATSSGMMGSTHAYEMNNLDKSDTRRSDVNEKGLEDGDVGGQVSERGSGVDSRKREHAEGEGQRGRPTKKQKEFKF